MRCDSTGECKMCRHLISVNLNRWQKNGLYKFTGQSQDGITNDCKSRKSAIAASITSPLNPWEFSTPEAIAALTTRSPVKDANTILRNALPLSNPYIRDIQTEIESIPDLLRIPGKKSTAPIKRAVKRALDLLQKNEDKIVSDFAEEKLIKGRSALSALKDALETLELKNESADRLDVPILQQKAAHYVTEIEESMIKAFPFSIPQEYNTLPQLLGRATLEMKVNYQNPAPDGQKGALISLVLDGYNAPISAGSFVDLVKRKFYDDSEIQRADGFVVQFGDPPGPSDGFVREDGETRRVPLEIRFINDKVINYGLNAEEMGRAQDQPALPFNSFGTLAWARYEFENNSASSQVFFLLKESELTPSGANLLDGRYAVFGYITEGQDSLAQIKLRDKIEYVKCISGCELLKNYD